MSLDLYMLLPPCVTCGHESEEMYFNCTSNLMPMWQKIYPESEEFVDIDGLTGEASERKIFNALVILEDRREEFVKLNPANGWGDYEGFVKFLRDVHDACVRYPNTVWSADR